MSELSHLRRTIKKVEFPYPVMVAGGAIKTAEQVKKYAKTDVIGEWGSITTDESSGNGGRDYHAEYEETEGRRILLFTQNSIGLINPGMSYAEQHAPDLIKLYEDCGKPLPINVSGNDVDDTLQLMQRAKACGFRVITVNGACPNKKGQPILCDDPDSVDELFDRAESVIGVSETVFLWKVSTGMRRPALAHNRKRLKGSKVFDGVITGNTVPNTLEYNERGETTIKTNAFVTRGGMGGPAIRPIALDHTEFMAECLATTKTVIGCGGIEDAWHVKKSFKAGAHMVQIHSAFREANEDPNFIRDLNGDLSELLQKAVA